MEICKGNFHFGKAMTVYKHLFLSCSSLSSVFFGKDIFVQARLLNWK